MGINAMGNLSCTLFFYNEPQFRFKGAEQPVSVHLVTQSF